MKETEGRSPAAAGNSPSVEETLTLKIATAFLQMHFCKCNKKALVFFVMLCISQKSCLADFEETCIPGTSQKEKYIDGDTKAINPSPMLMFSCQVKPKFIQTSHTLL